MSFLIFLKYNVIITDESFGVPGSSALVWFLGGYFQDSVGYAFGKQIELFESSALTIRFPYEVFRGEIWSFFTVEWENFFQHLTSLFGGNLQVALGQSILVWGIVVSTLPTMAYLVLVFAMLMFWQLEPVLKGPIERLFGWIYEHPRGPLALLSFFLSGVLMVIQMFL